uniref:Uncharacterized protein n=1 Tax=Mimivirus LCMiAC02 TaxID=2506609 RepID=A0A481Z0A8_9VIRU|nr:MAG: uncharacterized protein LCMiAC02_00350 [Mimivirus LCMiAC02]
MEEIKTFVTDVNKNKYVSSAIALFLILYAGLAAPKLPRRFAKIFENPIVKLIIFFLIAYTAKKDPNVAIIAAIALMVSLYTLSKYKFDDKIIKYLDTEYKQYKRELVGKNIRDIRKPQRQVPEEDLRKMSLGMNQEVPVAVNQEGCAKIAKYRNDFYPQYVNMKPWAYRSRYPGNTVKGYDDTSDYAKLQTV